jgi:3-phenylpropionate/cinnamic acid dioxygenase small subunit
VSPSDLADIEQIRQLKARYFRFLDTKQWEAWRGLFTDDFTAHVQGPHPDLHYATPEQLVQAPRSRRKSTSVG